MSFKVGDLPQSLFDGGGQLVRGGKTGGGVMHLQELLDAMQLRRVPGNVETAAFTAAVNDTWEDYDLVSALNLVLGTPLRTGEAYRLLGTLEVANSAGTTPAVFYGHGGMPDDDDTRRTFTAAAGPGSEFIHDVELLTDGDGNIKIETDDITALTLVFHLEAYQVVKLTAQT